MLSPVKQRFFSRQGRLLCNARVEVTGSTQLNAPNFVIKELSVMLVANKQEQQCQEKSGEQGVRGEQGGPRRGGGFEGRREHARQEALCTCVFRLLKYTQAKQSGQKAVFNFCRAEQVEGKLICVYFWHPIVFFFLFGVACRCSSGSYLVLVGIIKYS